MVDEDRLEALYDSTLKPRIAALDSLRVQLRDYIVRAGLLIGIPFGLFYFRDLIGLVLPSAVAAVLGTVSFIGIFVGALVAGVKYLLPGITTYANYKGRFKTEVVAEIVKVVAPTATYTPSQGIPASIFDSPGIFSTTGSYATDDRIRGRIGQTPFEAAEVHRWYSSGSGKDSKTYHVFHGLFFHFDFNKKLNGVTIVQPESSSSFQLGSRSGLTRVALESPDFEKEFQVYSSNEVEARYVLTPAMMERLLAVRQDADRPIFLGFCNNGAYLAVHYGRSLFEPDISETTSKGAILEMAQHFALADVIVNELDLNTRIWTKDVDESLLKRPDTAPQTFMETAAASAGTLTQKDLLKGAAAGLGNEYQDEIGKDLPKPARTLGRIDRDGQTVTVRYRWSLPFLFALAVSAAAVAVILSALRQIGASGAIGSPGDLLERVPTVAYFDRMVGEYGFVWLGVAFVVGGFFTLSWLFRVQRVVVEPGGVLIYRGFRPFPHRYSRADYPAILRLKNSVHLSKGEGLSLVNPTASPNLSEAEAGWVASELRKALK